MKETFPFDLLPGVVAHFIEKIEDRNESPREFLVASFLAATSALAGPHYRLEGGSLLNNYYLIIGRTSIDRKTTALSLGVELYERCISDCPDLSFEKVLPDQTVKKLSAYGFVSNFSVEGLLQYRLLTGTSTLARMNEYGTLFQIQRRQGQGNTITDLTDLYDCKPVEKVTVGKSLCARDYALTLLVSSTKEWIQDFGSMSNTSGGYTNRHLIFTGESSKNIANPKNFPPEEFIVFVETLKNNILPKDISYQDLPEGGAWTAKQLTMSLSQEASTLWESYYSSERLRLRKVRNPRALEIGGREDSHAKKLAALRALLEGRKIIGPDDLVFGARLARWSTRNALDLIIPKVDFDFGYYSESAKKIVSFLANEAPQSKTELAQRIGGKQDVVNMALKLLIDRGLIEKTESGYNLSLGSQVQESEVEEYFGKSSICDEAKKLNLETTGMLSSGNKLFDNESQQMPQSSNGFPTP